MESENCAICCQDSNKNVECFSCALKACKTCHEKYFLQSSQEPHCMNCRTAWSRRFLAENFNTKFLNNTLKAHREKILFERERSMLPATQIYVERYKKAEGLQRDLTQLSMQINELLDKRDRIRTRQLRLYRGEPDEDENVEVGDNEASTSENQQNKNRKFIRNCPKEGCLGFLSSRWKCGVCESNVCPDCHEIKKDDDIQHICNPDNVSTAKMLSKETKPCPKCGTLCMKVDGCDQVFAMCCETTFNWRTGKIDSGIIHAPDYFTWLRRNGKNAPRHPLDIPCGGLPHLRTILDLVTILLPSEDKHIFECIGFRHRAFTHIQMVELPKYINDNALPDDEENRNARVQYMMGRMSEARFKAIIQQNDKAKVKKQDISVVLNTVVTVGSDIFQRMIVATKHMEIIDLIKEADTIATYMNEIMFEISKTYNCVTPRITNNWRSVITLKSYCPLYNNTQ